MKKANKHEKVTISTNHKQTFKVKLNNWTNKVFIPSLGKLGQQRHLAALRDAFGTIIPLIIAGSIAILFITIGFGGWGSEKVSILGWIWMAVNKTTDTTQLANEIAANSGAWGKAVNIGVNMFSPINAATIGAMSIFVVFLIGYFIGLSRDFKQPIMSGLASLGCFMIIIMGQFSFFADAKGLFSAIIAGFIGSELLIAFSKIKKLELKLPAGVPPAVAKSFAVFVPMLFTLVIVAMINVIVWAPVNYLSNYDVFTVNQTALNREALKAVLEKAVQDSSLPTNIHDLLVQLQNAVSDNNALVQWFNANKDNADFPLVMNALLGHLDNPIIIDANHIKWTLGSYNELAQLLIIKYEQVQIPTSSFGLGAGIYRLLQTPFLGFVASSGGIGVALLFTFLVGFFWFFGIHGSNITAAIFEPIWWAVLGINAALVQSLGLAAAQKEMIAFAKPFFDSYMYIGGSGATLALLISTLIISKRKELKEVAKFSLPAGVFQINEPVIFGYPIILNPVWIAPFIIAPMLNVVVAWLAVSVFHFVNASYIATPWTAPWFLGALLSTGLDWRAFVLSLLCFAISLLIWFPAVLLDNKIYNNKIKKAENQDVAVKVKITVTQKQKAKK